MEYLFLTIFIAPLLSCLSLLCYGYRIGTKGAEKLSVGLLIYSFFGTCWIMYLKLSNNFSSILIEFNWINVEMFDASWGFFCDSLSIWMLLTVTFISTLVHIYSVEYMMGDPHKIRFLAYLSLFTFFMLMLIASHNFIQLFLGWEGVGLCSFLLISFWNTRLNAVRAAIKAIIINKIGDFGLSLGIFGIFYKFKSLKFATVFCLAPCLITEKLFFFTPNFQLNYITFICFFLFIGAMGKSAQIGLHTWLPDAMEGPTPVSALIHAATMVTAGVFLIIRCSYLFEYSPKILLLVNLIGAITTFFAGTVSLVQNDLKKIIAYSTCSQLGYMVFTCGFSHYALSLFHLINHASFKALLFLTAGVIIHNLDNEQDIRRMGGLAKILPFSYLMIFWASLALMGFPFLTGFYSKDVILETAFTHNFFSFNNTFAFWLGSFSAMLTATYSLRLLFLTFFSIPQEYKHNVSQKFAKVNFVTFLNLSKNNDMSLHSKSKKSLLNLTQFFRTYNEITILFFLPLLVLYINTLFFGYVFQDLFIGLGTTFFSESIFVSPKNSIFLDNHFISYKIKLIPLIFTLFGTGLIMLFQSTKYNQIFFYTKIVRLYKLLVFLSKKWYFDKLYNAYIASPFLLWGYQFSYKFLDRGIFELLGSKNIFFLLSRNSYNVLTFHSGYLFFYLVSFWLVFVYLGVVLFFFF